MISMPVSNFETSIVESVETAYQKIQESQEKSHVVIAPTGAWKSTTSGKKMVDRMRANLPTLFVASQKSDMKQFIHESLYPLITEEEKNKVQIISKEEKSKIEGYKSDTIIVTHKTYFTRKGLSPYHYAAMLWPDQKKTPNGIWVIIDEVQAYIESQKFMVKRGGRYAVKQFNDHGVQRKEICEECPCFNNRGNCSQCKISEENFLYCNTNGILEIRTHVEGRTGKDFDICSLPEIKIKSETKYKTLIIRELEERKNSGRVYTAEKTGENPTIKTILEDLLSSAYKPKCYMFQPVIKETEEMVDWKSLKLDFEQAEIMSQFPKQEIEEKRKIKEKYTFPKTACNIEMYEFLDKSSLEYLAKNEKIEKIIFLGATLREDQKEFLQECCPGFLMHEIKEAKVKIDDLAIVIFRKKVDFVKKENKKSKVLIQKIADSLKEEQRVLIFSTRKTEARAIYEEFPEDYPVAIIKGDDVSMEEPKLNEIDKKGKGDYKIGITWENGPLGRGINRPYDYVTFIDPNNYLPIICYGHDGQITPEVVENGYRAKIEDTTIQCGGRIMRRGKEEARKLVVLHNIQEIEPNIQNILSAWQGLVAKPISFLFVEEEQEYLMQVCESWLKEGLFPEQSEKEFAREKLAEKAKDEMTKAEREKLEGMEEGEKTEYQETRKNVIQEGKEKKRLERLISKGKELKKEGKNCREIYDILKMQRYKELWEIVKQELGFTG